VSAIVLAALVVMWAVVLVPMFLRRHEKATEMDGVHRFSGAMRVLSRRRRGPAAVATTRAPHRLDRAAVISRALDRAPERPVRRTMRSDPPEPSPARAAGHRAHRVAARRRGLGVMLAAILLTAVLALVLGGWLIALQAFTDVLALAGVAQLRASAMADRYARGMPRSAVRAEARITDAPVSPHVVPVAVRSAAQAAFTPVAEPAPGQVVDPVGRPLAARRPGKQIVFDAVTEMPIVEKPRVAPKPVKRVGVPDDFYERPVSPPRPERVYSPLLDEVDSDPDTLTGDLQLLDGILRKASGE
jgi:hypothetical protein